MIVNCTLSRNHPYGIDNMDGLYIANSIVWGNGGEKFSAGDSIIRHSNIDLDDIAGSDGNIRLDPQFISAENGDFRLSATSPSIDTGSNASAGYVHTDVAGTPRIMDGDGDGTATVDMGAHEAFFTTTGNSIGIQARSGTRIIRSGPVDPAAIDTMPERPDHLIHGLIQTSARVHAPGATAQWRYQLPEPLPEGYRWFMHIDGLGWIDFSRDVVSDGTGDGTELNDDRSEVTLYITDNGPYDDDPADGVVSDPTGPGTPGMPDLSADLATMDFGSVETGDSALHSVVISNSGTVELDINTVSLTGTHAAEFDITMDECSGESLPYSESGTIGIRFSPSSPGAKSATVSIASNDPDTAVFSIPLSGTGVEPTRLTGLSISGPATVNESSGAQYTCLAQYSDGTSTDVTGTVQWSEDSMAATIDSAGYLTTHAIDGDQECTLVVSYEDVTQSMVVGIVDTSDTSDKSGGGGGSGCFVDTLPAWPGSR